MSQPLSLAPPVPTVEPLISPVERDQLLQSMSPRQLKVYKRVAGHFVNIHKDSLRREHAIGLEVIVWLEDETELGDGFVRTMGKLLGMGYEYLIKRRDFAREFDDEALDRLLDMRIKVTHQPLSYGYVVPVLCLPEDERWCVLERCCEESWSLSQLKSYVSSLNRTEKGSTKSNSGRKIAIPASFSGRVMQIKKTLTPLSKLSNVWTSQQHGILASAQQLRQRGKAIDPVVVKTLSDIVDSFDEHIDTLSRCKREFTQGLALLQEMDGVGQQAVDEAEVLYREIISTGPVLDDLDEEIDSDA